MQIIKDSGGLKVSDEQVNAWLNLKEQKDQFGNYFLKGDNRFKIIETLAKYGDDLSKIKNLSPDNNENLYKIPVSSKKVEKPYVPGVYTFYLWNKLKYKGFCWSYACEWPIIYGISTEILKDKPWIACYTNMQGRCIDEGSLWTDFYGKGNLSKKPNMENLKKVIHRILNEIRNSIYHEVIFKEIPLKYIKVIFVTKKYLNEAKRIFPDIPVVEIAENQVGRHNYKEILEPYANKN
jgi:hypothetical protein